MNWAGEDTGFLAFLVIASPENLPQARQAFEDITRRLRDDLLPEATLDRAKAMLEAGYYRSLQRRAGRADAAAANVLRRAASGLRQTTSGRIEKVDPGRSASRGPQISGTRPSLYHSSNAIAADGV